MNQKYPNAKRPNEKNETSNSKSFCSVGLSCANQIKEKTMGCTWPEQDAVDKWIEKHEIKADRKQTMELKEAATKYRVEVQCQRNELKEALNNLLNDCINFDGGKLTDCIMEQASDILKQYQEE